MDACPFCTTYKDLPSTPGGILFEDRLVYVHHYCRDEGPSYLGHLLLKTKRHVPGLADLTEAEGQAVGQSIARLSKALQACTGAEKIYVEAYYEVVPHLHLHLLARYPETPQEYWRWKIGEWPQAPQGGPTEIADLCERLQAYLAQTVRGSVEPHHGKGIMKGQHSMNTTPMKPHILALLHFTRQQEVQLIANLSDAERNATGIPNAGTTKDAWTVKDFLANMLRWKELQTQNLAIVQRGEVPPVWTDMEVVHQINSETFTRYRTSTFQAIEEEAEHVFNAFITQVERMSEEELNDPHYYAWLEGARLRNEVLNYGLWLPCNQLTICALQLGKKQLAFQLQEALVQAVRQSTLPDEGVGVALYNMVCFYATNGEPEKALHHLPEALRLRPTLVEVSKRDSDLESLRANPAFQAILTDPVLLARVPLSDLVKPHDLHTSLRGEVPPLVIDVRGSAEYVVGHVAGAVNIPLGTLESQLSQIPHERPVVTYCNMHNRGASRGEQAAAQLREQGYQVRTLDGGYPAWKEQSFPVEAALQV